MSADNGYLIRRHPEGGYAAVMYFASDDDPDLSVKVGRMSFETPMQALAWAELERAEYGVTLDEEVRADIEDIYFRMKGLLK